MGETVDLRTRHALIELAGGAVLVDLLGGSVHRLNSTAARMCRALLAGESAETIAADIARRFGIDARAALEDVGRVHAQLTCLDDGPARAEPSAPLTFDAEEGGFAAYHRDRPMWRLRGNVLALVDSSRPTDQELDQSLRWLLPHLLTLRGHRVLHAAANIFDDGAHAYVGRSGAGKTTLAESFAHGGRPVASRDLLILGNEARTVRIGAEDRLHAWAAVQAGRASPIEIDVEEIEPLLEGPVTPLSRILFLAAERRERALETIALEAMAAGEAFSELLMNAFGELGRPVWPHLVRFLHPIARDVPAYRATLPDGLDTLRTASMR